MNKKAIKERIEQFIENYLINNYIFFHKGHFQPSIKKRHTKLMNRLAKILDFKKMKNKSVLVLGDGVGDFGGFFASIGCNVLILEGRQFNVNIARLRCRNLKNIRIELFDLNNDFTKFGKFDYIINFGLIEVIENLDNMLNCCAKVSDNIFIETLVTDTSDVNYKGYELMDTENTDNGLTERCSRPSEFYIERFFEKKGFNVIRFFDKEINTDWIRINDKKSKPIV